MKRISSILFACLLGALTLVGSLSAQTYNGGAGPVDWQDPLTWGIPNYWPGRLNDGSTANLRPTAAVVFNNANPVNRVKVFDLQTNFGVTLNGTGTLVIGALKLNFAQPLTIGPGLNVVVDSIIDGSAGSTIIIQAGATLTLRRGAGAPAVQVVDGGTLLAAGSVNGTLVIENGFNNGILPTGLAGAFLNPFLGEVILGGNFIMNDSYTRAAAHGPLTLNGGQLTVTPGVTLTLNQTTPNSLQGTGTLQGAVGGIIALGTGFNAGIIPGPRFANPLFGQLQFVAGNFQINGNMTLGTANGTTAQQGIMNIVAAASTITVSAGSNLTLNGSIANSLQGLGFLTAANGGTITLGPGFNAGTIPARFATIAGNLVTQGPLQWNITGGIDPFSTTGTLSIGGDLALIGNGRFAFTPIAPNSLSGTGAARITAQGPNTVFMFNPNSNNGVIPGNLFGNPFDGGITVNGPMSLTGTLSMSTVSGPFQFNNQGSVVTIQSGAELFLQRNTAGAVIGQPANTAGNSGIAYNSYFQGISSGSTLRLGAGFNGGGVPTAIAGAGNMVSFLPIPFVNTTTGQVPGFNGRLVLEGSLTFNRDLRIGPAGSIVLGGNLTVAQGRVLQLYNSGANSVTGTGFLQAVAPTTQVWAPVAGSAITGSIIELGPGFNGAVIPAARFANPFQGNLCVTTSGNLSIQGDLVVGVPGTIGYLNFNQSLNTDVTFTDPATGTATVTRISTSGTTRLTINPNSSLRLNGIGRASVFGAAPNSPGVSPPNTIQGTDNTSVLTIGTGHGSNNNVYALTTNATFLASPFNGRLVFDSFTYLATDATIGVNSILELGGTLILTEATVRGQDGNAGIAGRRILGTTLTLLNQGANSITGLGEMQAGTGNTIVLGANANGGILPGARFSNPYYGTIATVGAMTLNGFLQMGAQRDGRPNGTSTQQVSSAFLALGGRLTVGAGSVLTVSNATVNPFVVYDPLNFQFGQRFFQNSTAGNLDAAVGGEIRLGDGFAAMDRRSYAAEGAVNAGGQSFDPTFQTPTRSNIRGDVFASPFNGRLTLGFPIGTGAAFPATGTAVGGRSRFNMTTGTLTIGPSGQLNLISPLYLTSATPTLNPAALSNGFPVLVLNNTGAGSLLTSTTGSFIQSSVGSFSLFPAAVPAASLFSMTGGNETTTTTGGTVLLGPGFNGGTIEGRQFGDEFGFSGQLRLPASGNFTLASNLTMLSPSFLAAAAPGLKPLNYGILDLGGSSGTPVLTIADGITLSLGTTATRLAVPTTLFTSLGLALQGAGTIQGATNNARLQFNGTHGTPSPQTGGAPTPQIVAARSMTVTAANIASPFNGRLVFNTSGTASIVGNIVLGAPGSASGILELSRLDGTAGVTNSPTFVPVGNNSSLTINNTSPVAAVLPGTGIVTATTNFGSIILGPNALGNIIPAVQLQNPFIGRLIVTTGSAAFTLGADLRLGNDQVSANRNAPGALNGYLHAFSPININSGITLSVHNTSLQALRGTGPIQGADGNATVRFLAETHLAATGFAGNAGIVPGRLFADPYNGRVSLESVVANTTGYHLYGGLTLGASGSANGFLSVSGATLYLAAATSATWPANRIDDLVLTAGFPGPTDPAVSTVGTLTINNTLPVEQVLPGGGSIYPKGQTNNQFNPHGALNGTVNARLIYGPGSLANIVPFHKSSTSTVAGTGTLPAGSVWQQGIYGTIITPNTSVTATSGTNPAFINGGTLVIGTSATPTVSTSAELVLNANQLLTIGTSHGGALAGIGSIRVPTMATNATVRFGGTDGVNVSVPATTAGNGRANGGLIPGDRFGSNYLGTIRYHDNMNMNGTIRLGDGSATTGRLVVAPTVAPAVVGGSLLTVLQNSTLDLRTVTNGIGNTGATVATGLIAGVDTTSRVILHPGFASQPSNPLAGSAIINQSQALFNSPFLGAVITSTGTTTLFGTAAVTLTIGNGTAAAGGLEMGGDFVVLAPGAFLPGNTLNMNQAGPNTFRQTVGSTGLLLANPTNSVGTGVVSLGAGFNNGVLPASLMGASSGVPNQFGNTTVPTLNQFARLDINGGTFLTLSGASGSATTPANFTINQDLNFTNLGGGIHIPASSTLRVLQGFSAAATASPVSQGYVQGTTGFGATQSVLSIGAQTRNGGNALSATTPVVGSIRAAAVPQNPAVPNSGVPAFTGLLRFEGNGNITGIAVTLGTTSALDLADVAVGRLLTVNANSTLNLLNQGANTLLAGNTASFIRGTGATSIINLGAGMNGGILPGAYFGPTTTGLEATLSLGSNSAAAAGPAAPGSTLTLGSSLSVAGVFDFTGNGNDLILAGHNATMNGTIRNQTATQFFVTNGAGELRLANVGTGSFFVGPSQAVFAPITITNNGAAAIFGARALGTVTQQPAVATGSTTIRQSIVNQQWNVTQVSGVTPNTAIAVSPSWVAGQEGAGFNRTIASTTIFPATPATPTASAPAPAISDPLFANYFRSSVTLVQTAGNLLNNTPVLVSSQPAPAIISFTPTAQSSGNTIRIIGNRFVSGATVRLGGVLVPTANVALRSGTGGAADTLVVTVPTNAMSGDVVVTQTGGTATATGFTFLGAPQQPAQIFRVNPSPISAGIGDAIVTITGAAFGTTNPRVVAVGNGITSTITPTASSQTSITFSVPAEVVRQPGTLQLTVTSNERLPVSTNVTLVVAPPVALANVTPSSTTGNLAPYTISLTGSSFSPQSVFSIGGTRLRVVGFTANPDGSLTARLEVPAGVSGNAVQVQNVNGSTASIPFMINSLPRPVITSVNPGLIPPGSPDVIVTVRGRFFIPGATASFNGTSVSDVTTTGDSLVTVRIPAALLMNPDLAVLLITNPDGQSIGYRLPITTTAPGAISLTALTPSVTTASGTPLTLNLTGIGFAGTVRVFVGGTSIAVVSTTATGIVATLPANLNVPGTVMVQVANAGGVVSNALPLTINPAIDPGILPSISSVTPRSGHDFGFVNGNITITGLNFTPTSVVRLGSTQLVIVSVSANQIVATVPASLAANTYILTITNTNGAVGSQAYIVNRIVSVSNQPLAGIRVYPNPVAETVTVSANIERAAKVVISVTNSLGQRVMVEEQNAAAGFFSRQLNISNLPSGAYMVEITDGVRRSVEKIVKN